MCTAHQPLGDKGVMSGSDILTGTLDLVILKVLEAEALHGYGIGRKLERISGGELSIGEGVLYPALHRLEERKLLRARWGKTETGRKAKFYALTARGTRELAKKSENWGRKSRAAMAILGES